MLKKLSVILILSAGLVAGSAAMAAGQTGQNGFANDTALQMAIEAAKQMLKGTQAIQATSDTPRATERANLDKTLILGSPEAVPM